MTAMTSTGSAVLTLPTDTQILITREFAAPKHLVFKAYTTPELDRALVDVEARSDEGV